ncbi:RHS repeat-associated core domain-containing protein, partial [Achromobacter sp. K91]|uniref:RHS repeat-associated core domain-containing protein n=1 Tax=Achromobacter sp. K91 TaxID=2292262 RepID=UPI000ED6B242
ASTSEAKYKTIRYSGKERDAAGLYYYGMRYYQPWIGRWITTDPGGVVDGLNLYRAMGNNPTTFVDRLGNAKTDPSPYQSRRFAPPNLRYGADQIVAFMEYPELHAEPAYNPSRHFGGRVLYHINGDSDLSRYTLRVGTQLTEVDLEEAIHKAMAGLSETAKEIGVAVAPEKKEKKSNVTIKIAQSSHAKNTQAVTDIIAHRKKFPQISIAPSLDIPSDLAAAIHLSLRGDQKSMGDLLGQKLHAEDVMGNLVDADRLAIAEIFLLQMLAHEGAHAIFRLGHPDSIASARGASNFDDDTYTSGTVTVAEMEMNLDFSFQIHPRGSINLMTTNATEYFQSFRDRLMNSGIALSEKDIDLSSNEKASIFRKYWAETSLQNNKQPARLLACFRRERRRLEPTA